MSAYAKAFAAAVSTIIMFLLFDDGSGKDPEVLETAIATVVTTFLVYVVPNRGRPVR